MGNFSLGEAVLGTLVDLTGLNKGLGDAEKNSESTFSKLGGIASKGLGAAMGIATAGLVAVTGAVIGVGTAAFNAGMTMDSAFDSITVATGATGTELTQLESDFKAVFASVPTDAGTAADVIGALNTRLGVSGQALQDLSKPLLEATRLLGGDAKTNAELFTRVMGDWSIPVEQGGAALDKFFTISQNTGAGLESLMGKVVQFGSPLRLMGFSLDESLALFGKWEKEGVNAELVMGSLRIAAGKFAKEQDAGNTIISGGVANMAEANKKLLELTVGLEAAQKAQDKLNTSGSQAQRDLNALKIQDYQAAIAGLQGQMAKGEFVYDTAAQSQKTLHDRLLETFTSIKDNKDESAALAEAMEVFGARAGPDMAAAIREGRFSIDDLLATMKDADGAILGTADRTADFGERWQIMSNKLTVAMAPVGIAMMDIATAALDALMPALDSAMGVVGPFAETLGGAISTFASGDITGGIETLSQAVGQLFGAGAADGVMSFGVMIYNAIPKIEGIAGAFSTLLGVLDGGNPFNIALAKMGLFGRLMDVFGPDIAGTVMGVIDVFTNLVSFFKTNWPTIQATIQNVIAAVTTVFQGIVNWVITNWPTIQLTIETVASVVSTNFANMQAVIQAVMGAIGVVIIALLPTFTDLWNWLQVNIPIAIQTLANFWTTTLQPAIQAVGAWINDNLLPLLTNLWNWLQVNIPIALQTLSTFWTTTLLPAIQSVQTWVNDTLLPLLTNLWNWLQVNLPIALQTLSNFWSTVLWPAIQAVWGWMNETLFPFLTALSEFFSVTFSLAITALAGLWQNVLLPVLVTVATYLSGTLLPIWEKLQKFFDDTLTPAMEKVQEYIANTLVPLGLTLLTGAFGGISEAIKTVTGWLETMTKMLKEIKLPDWLTPGSPTPFENGLVGIADAMDVLAGKRLPEFNSQLNLTEPMGGIMGVIPEIGTPSGKSGSAGSQVINITFGPDSIRVEANAGQSAEEIAQQVIDQAAGLARAFVNSGYAVQGV